MALKDRSELSSDIAAKLADNTTAEISEEDQRDIHENSNESNFNLKDDSVEVIKDVRPRAVQTLSDGTSIAYDIESGKNAKVTIAGNRTINLENLVDGDEGKITVTQDATGGRTLTLGQVNAAAATHKIENNQSNPVLLSIGPNTIGVLKFYYDGAVVYWSTFNNFV